ncbi:MAG: methylenetetrahydrofolate reductase C-terminal domain-containing protein [Desulfobacterota bacterium]|nr:methylenetetrahydrofolate reductase C-terminal domain-containing protein [Thermodesulfobacteriota bacterium]MDW8001490.1 methylenetetrahydrofolate reductase C-terminal domain-containing protein [Deltaproteobacteria bacterium]
MIVATRKPIEEIIGFLAPYDSILILGCGTCVTVCNSGGEREVALIHSALRVAQTKGLLDGKRFHEYTVKRQCDNEFLEAIKGKSYEVDAILTLACGVGVQVLAEFFPHVVCIPGLNTLFMGSSSKLGIWDERCAGCGDCRLYETGGICPITRCAKGILNGPCGGSKDGKCEVDREMDCGWIMIYERLLKLGRVQTLRTYVPPREYSLKKKPKRVMIA